MINKMCAYILKLFHSYWEILAQMSSRLKKCYEVTIHVELFEQYLESELAKILT